jgi:hypothetical protein
VDNFFSFLLRNWFLNPFQLNFSNSLFRESLKKPASFASLGKSSLSLSFYLRNRKIKKRDIFRNAMLFYFSILFYLSFLELRSFFL